MMALVVTRHTIMWRTACCRAQSSIGVTHGSLLSDVIAQQNAQLHYLCSRHLSAQQQRNSNGVTYQPITFRYKNTTTQSGFSSKNNSVTSFQCDTNMNSLFKHLHSHSHSKLSNCSHSSLQSHPSAPLSTLSSTQTPLLQVCDRHQFSHHAMSSHSPAQLIMESCPLMVQPYLRLIRFDKPIGTWLLYWPCTWSIAMATPSGSLPDMKLLALFGAGAFFMRGAGCIINDLWDKDYDAKVERTKQRPLACGELSSFQATMFLGSQLTCALAILLQLNWYSVFLGAASMGLVVIYPLAKRYTYWPQLVLGFTFNYGALLGWSAVQGSNDWAVCLPLYVSCILWTLVYDTIYAHQDKYDDMLIGVKSTALKFGDQTKPWLFGFTSLMCGGLTSVGIMGEMTWPYYLAVVLTCSRLTHQIHTVNLNSSDECAQAFRGNVYLGVIMFTGIVMANLLKESKQDVDERPEAINKPVTAT